jgi:hemin uptake protein HemP
MRRDSPTGTGTTTPQTGPASRAPGAGGGPARLVRSEALLGPDRAVWIAHGGETYRLQLTRQGKLILTK